MDLLLRPLGMLVIIAVEFFIVWAPAIAYCKMRDKADARRTAKPNALTLLNMVIEQRVAEHMRSNTDISPDDALSSVFAADPDLFTR